MVYCGANLNSRKKKEDAIFHANRYVTRYVGLIVGEHIIDVIYSKSQRRVCICVVNWLRLETKFLLFSYELK